ncbi:hypothetical protein BD779DRAFT_1800562, partial [Infundibulicybe gibba]
MQAIIFETPLNNETTRRMANREAQTQHGFPKWNRTIVREHIPRRFRPLPLGYLLRYPIDILIRIFRLACDDATTPPSLSRVSKFFREVCKFITAKFTLSRSGHVAHLIEPNTGGAEAGAEHYRQLINPPNVQTPRGECPSKRVVLEEQFLCGKPHSIPRHQLRREMCDRETQVVRQDFVVPSWASLTSSRFIRRPQPPPQGYLLNYPTDLLTHILGFACIDDSDAGRSLCLVSKGFYEAVKPVMLYWVRLKRPSQIMWLGHLFSIDTTTRWRIRRLTIDFCKLDLDRSLVLEEPNWDEVESIGSFHWDSDYWGDPQAGYLDESDSDESEDSFESGEETDLDQDVAFFASPEGRARENLIYDAAGELAAVARWPWDVRPEKASAFVNDATSNVLHALAPALRHLKLISKGSQSSITLPTFPQLSMLTLPTFPQLSVLTIRAASLSYLRCYSYVLFPALKTLRIQGRPEMGQVSLDHLIYHAPSVTLLRVCFDENLLRDIVE